MLWGGLLRWRGEEGRCALRKEATAGRLAECFEFLGLPAGFFCKKRRTGLEAND